MSKLRFHHVVPMSWILIALFGFGCGSLAEPPATADQQIEQAPIEPAAPQTVTVTAVDAIEGPPAGLQAPVAAAPADTSDIEIAAAGMDADANELRDVIVAIDEMVASALQLQRSLMTARTAGMAPLVEEIARLEAEQAEAEAAAAAGAQPAKEDESGGEETQADEGESGAQQEKAEEGEQADEAEESEADSASGEETDEEEPAEDDDAPDDEP